MIEPEVRLKIDQLLSRAGWVLDPEHSGRNVYLEGALKDKLTKLAAQKLGAQRPDYTLFHQNRPIAVIEAKKTGVSLTQAIEQAKDYALKIGIDIAFASNGRKLQSLYIPDKSPLYYNDIELSALPDPNLLAKFLNAGKSSIYSTPERVINSREQLIELIATWSDLLRGAGIRSGVERFTEFANLLFLKLLSESEADDGVWSRLVNQEPNQLTNHINGLVLKQLDDRYGSEVIAKTNINDGEILQKMIVELNSLSLSSVDEDVKGVAFEHFIQRTTTQNDLGEYFTPRHIVRFMVNLINPSTGQTVFDPFCGTGGFLVETYRHLSRQIGRSRQDMIDLQTRTIFGQEITSNARIAKMNMILFGDGHSGVTQANSITIPPSTDYDVVLSNIPFSQRLPIGEIKSVDLDAKNADEACLLRCFHSLSTGGSMAVVIPEGLVVNNSNKDMWVRLFRDSRVRVVASFPRGCFSPYTEAATRMVYLTDKGVNNTSWFYYVAIADDGYTEVKHGVSKSDINDLQEFLFFYSDSEDPIPIPSGLDRNVSVVLTKDMDQVFSALRNSLWPMPTDREYVELRHVALLENGTPITEAETSEGTIPVIAGGQTSRYSHNQRTHDGNLFTVSKSGAYSGYVWWHSGPIWASDSIAIRSMDESKFLTAYLYAVVKSYQDEIYTRQQGTGQPHIYRNHIESIPIPVLSLSEQEAKVSQFLESIAALEAQQNVFDNAHKAMLDSVRN